MYAQSATRQTFVAVVLVAALAGLVAASIDAGSTAATLAAQGAPTIGYAEALPQLPEVVVVARRW